jgi:hypothetical protein
MTLAVRVRDRLRSVGRLALPFMRTRSPLARPGQSPGLYVVIAVDTEGDFGTTPRANWRQRQGSTLSLGAYSHGGQVWRAFQPTWRDRHRDALGERPRVTWFVRFDQQIAGAGRRDLVYGALVEAGAEQLATFGDEIGWHHHHLRWEGVWRFDANHDTNRDHEAALAAFIKATGSFPSAFRSGMLMEPPGLHRWLENHIPFDYSLLIGPPHRRGFTDDELGLTVDWAGAPNDWRYYHPDPADLTRLGDARRVLFPSSASPRWVEAAVIRARAEPVVLTFWVHDFEPLIVRISRLLRRIARKSQELGVPYRFATASEAARTVLNLPGTPPRLTVSATGTCVRIAANQPLFGPAPFVAAGPVDQAVTLELRSAVPLQWETEVTQSSLVIVGAASEGGATAAVTLPV